MDRVSAKSITVNQATGKRFVIRVIFNNFPLENAKKHLIKRQTVRLSLFVSVIGYSNLVPAYRLNKVLYLQRSAPFR